jgi:2-polyprenyl-6-methoxyphenol hydroxylase-like FAD-dependent oxidoreductase
MSGSKREHAIVIGASMGGLLAARVLSDHFQSVTILEQDSLPPNIYHRRGVPQSRHTHGLLTSGSRTLGELFPGLTAELLAAGALSADIVRDGRWIQQGGPLCRFRSGLNGLLLSRPLLEGAVRRRVLALPNVRICEMRHVIGIITSEDRRSVCGVRSVGPDGVDEIRGDLTIDAAGRASHTPDWLRATGWQPPEAERVEIALGYTTRPRVLATTHRKN